MPCTPLGNEVGKVTMYGRIHVLLFVGLKGGIGSLTS
jgi:hypothetical protein